MSHFVMARWLLREWLRNRWTWLLAMLAALLGPVCWTAGPIGITTNGISDGSYLASQWFLSAYLGAFAALILRSRAGDLWDELDVRAQTALGWCVAAILGLLHAALAVGPACWLAANGASSWLGGVLCIAHWAALAAFLQRLPLSLPASCVGLTLVGWWIPALLAGDMGAHRTRWVLGPARHLELVAALGETPGRVLADTIPILAWWVAAALLPPRSAFRR